MPAFPFHDDSMHSVKVPNLRLYLLGRHLDVCRGKECQSIWQTKIILLTLTFRGIYKMFTI